MNYILLSITVILLITIAFLLKTKREIESNLAYIADKAAEIAEKNSNEKLLLFTENKQIQGLLISINNILSHSQQINANYQKTEISKRKMLANISHDLKTPLTVILGCIEAITVDKYLSSDEQDSLLNTVREKTQDLIGLIDKFFFLTQLESGDKDILLSRININEICRKNILAFYNTLNENNFKVQLEIPEEIYYVLGNEDSINRVLDNLISNSLKYGHDGKFIGLCLYSNSNFVYVDIWDKGKGIDKVHYDSVFERLYTLEDSRNKDYQGSGLGLTISKSLVEKMEGEISLSSIPFTKTVFTIKLKRVSF